MSCQTTRKRSKCNEECLDRIAARLHRLDAESFSVAGLMSSQGDSAACEDSCCVEEATVSSADEIGNDSCCTVTKASESASFEGKIEGVGSGSGYFNDEKAGETSDGCCSKDESGAADYCCSSEKVTKVTSACCARSMKPSSGCDVQYGKEAADDCCSSDRATQANSGCCAPTTNASRGCCSENDLPDKAVITGSTAMKQKCNASPSTVELSCSAGEKACGTSPSNKSDCCIKSPNSSLISVKDCNDTCFQEEDAPSSAPSADVNNFQSTMNRLEAMLKKGQCLCRRVKEQYGFNCCDPASATAGLVTRKRGASPTPSKKSSTEDKAFAVSSATAIHTRCSFDASDEVKNRKKEATVKSHAHPVDIEKDSAREHVVLDVSGMTCTGCSKKMMNVLNGISGLSNAQVTFVSGNAEFDLDLAVAGKAEDVLARVERETGFKCSRLISGLHVLHVMMSPAAAKGISDALPTGVMSVVKDKKNKDNYYITYNPRVVGARSLLPPTANLAPPQDSVGVAEGKRRLISTATSTVLAAVLTIPVVVLEWSDNQLPSETVELVALILGTGVQAIAIPEFYIGAVKSLIYSHVIEMDMLVVISITSAYLYSVVAFGLQRAGVNLEQGPFFETSTLLITLVLLGRLMAAWARMKALSTVSLRTLQADTALLIGPSGEPTKVDARLLQLGDSIVIHPHSRVVTDGSVSHGTSEVDESMVTGESLPVSKQRGDILIAGTINGSGTLHVRLTRLPGENSITDIATLVEKAVAAKPRVQDLADRFASYFIPAVVGIAVIVFCIWIAIAIQIRNRNGGGAVGLAITYAIAVLAISCPCALGLAVPMVLVIAGGVAARAGVVIKAADAIERSHRITDVVFDKTGTLTEGDLQVIHMQALPLNGLSEDEILILGKTLVESNEHPVSVAVASHLAEIDMSSGSKPRVENVTSIPGGGIEAHYRGSLIKAGNPYWLNLEHHSAVLGLLEQAMTILCITLAHELILVIGLKSSLRSNAANIIADLHRRKITTHIVSGDNPAAVLDIARTLGVEESNIRSRSSPSQKQEYVHTLQNTSSPGNKKRTVLFIGDGTNDAVAIAQSDVGVQMGSASDVTGAISDVVILSHDLSGLITLLDLSKRAVRRIQFNFVWSGVYNLFAILLAAGAFVRVRIPPAYAGLGEIVSVGPVILAAVSLMWSKKVGVRSQ
ncbi:related to P-type ATPase [Ramularia collo-cygni]|uniref:Related to P-type ATPase n=1 Tax=Ramularia collo-cygni TaxID=112498 RepID=A0A2D3UT74_9PEZI|nr:related to P-type ATPase [Ramularia collo-cygni]CZT14987.1 related to P-type ATPase [Ramularia collo-cygni]